MLSDSIRLNPVMFKFEFYRTSTPLASELPLSHMFVLYCYVAYKRNICESHVNRADSNNLLVEQKIPIV